MIRKARKKFVSVGIVPGKRGTLIVTVDGEDVSDHVEGYTVKSGGYGRPPEVMLRLRATTGALIFAKAHLGLNIEEMVEAAAASQLKRNGDTARDIAMRAVHSAAAKTGNPELVTLLQAYVMQDRDR